MELNNFSLIIIIIIIKMNALKVYIFNVTSFAESFQLDLCDSGIFPKTVMKRNELVSSGNVLTTKAAITSTSSERKTRSL